MFLLLSVPGIVIYLPWNVFWAQANFFVTFPKMLLISKVFIIDRKKLDLKNHMANIVSTFNIRLNLTLSKARENLVSILFIKKYCKITKKYFYVIILTAS